MPTINDFKARTYDDFKAMTYDHLVNDVYRGYPEEGLSAYNDMTEEDWQELYIAHIEERIESMEYDLKVDLRWLDALERIETTRKLKAYKEILKQLKGKDKR